MTGAAAGQKRSLWLLAAFILVVTGIGFLIGGLIRPDAWFATLTKPSLNPPAWLFGPVWAVVYVLIAIAGWRTWTSDEEAGRTTSWTIQLFTNYSWTPVFFGLHAIRGALAVIIALLVQIVIFIVISWRNDRTSALLFFPYAIWVMFASVLNLSIFMLN